MIRELNPSDLSAYPPQAKQFATDNISTLRQLPPILCALLLKQIQKYDWLFPAERTELDNQLHWIRTADRRKLEWVILSFRAIKVSPEIMDMPWGAQPGPFIERLTAELWTTHSIDAFQSTAKRYGNLVESDREDTAPRKPRLCVVFVGAGSPRGQEPLFEKLRPYGTYFSQVDMASGVPEMIGVLRAIASRQPGQYQHWYVDGGVADPSAFNNNEQASEICTLSYRSLDPERLNVINTMNEVRTSGAAGPERLRSLLAEMHPEGTVRRMTDPIMRNFTLELFTGGSGTQIFSTTFVQWAGREILRRARPQTLFLRFRLRQIERPMDELLQTKQTLTVLDPVGSLLDSDMGAFYTWINLQRLPGGAESRFLACYEDGHEALVVAPGIPKGATSDSKCSLKDLL
jgi:hypothetical protein